MYMLNIISRPVRSLFTDIVAKRKKTILISTNGESERCFQSYVCLLKTRKFTKMQANFQHLWHTCSLYLCGTQSCRKQTPFSVVIKVQTLQLEKKITEYSDGKCKFLGLTLIGLFICPVYFWNALQLGTDVFDRHLPNVVQSATNLSLWQTTSTD